MIDNDSTLEDLKALLSYPSELLPDDLTAMFTLSARDKLLLEQCRTPQTTLGMAVQLCSLRSLGSFIQNASSVPMNAQDYLRDQLRLKKVNLQNYFLEKITRIRHQHLIREYLGFYELHPVHIIAIGRVLLNRLFVSEEKEAVLVELVMTMLLQRQVVLPGITTIERFVRKAKERVRTRLYKQIYLRLSKTYCHKLQELLTTPKGDYRTRLEILRSSPSHSSSTSIVTALERLNSIHNYTVSTLRLEDIAQNRLAILAKDGLTTKAQIIGLYSRERCYSTLAVTMWHLEQQATDDVLTMFDTVMKESSLRAQRRYQRQRLRSLRDLDRAALTLRDAARVILDTNIQNKDVRKRILESIGESTLQKAVLEITEMTNAGDDLESQAWKRPCPKVRVLGQESQSCWHCSLYQCFS